MRHRWITHYAPLIIWTGVVLFMSTPNASMAQTSRFIGPLIEFLFPGLPAEQIAVIHGYVRKCAHFTEYGLLAFFAFRAFVRSGSRFIASNGFLLALAYTASIATIDEFNQSFEPTRTSSPWDVLLDCAGGATVSLICWYVWRRTIQGEEARNRQRSHDLGSL